MKLFVAQAIGLALLCIIFWPVFSSNFAYLDEAHQLWYNDSDANYEMFLVHGRWLTGLIQQKLFSSITTVSGLKLIRIISLAGWAVASIVWTAVVYHWKKVFRLDEGWAFFLIIFLPCSITVAIAIGWAVCMQLFLAFVLALLGGQLLFNTLYGKDTIRIPLLSICLVVLSGVSSLFLYQPMFAAFLLPFFLYHLINRFKKIDKLLYIGITFYLGISVLYFILLKYSIAQSGAAASGRTGLTHDPIGKLSFFFSQPLAQAFSFNFMYNMHSIFSQAFYPVMLAVWIISLFALEREVKLLQKFTYIGRMLVLLLLLYVSVLLPVENFSAYRTMLCLNLAGTMLLTDALLRLIKHNSIRKVTVYGACVVVAAVAWYNFNLNYIQPLTKEYKALHSYFQQHYDSTQSTAYFVRPPEHLFTRLYTVNVFKDEFGMPAGFKDWTPEPLIRQMVFEATGNKDKAKRLSVVNLPYEERDRIGRANAALIIDEEYILLSTMAVKR